MLFILLNAIVWFLADTFFIGAYTSGGNLMTVATIVVMFPIVASLLKYILTRTPPTPWHVAGWLVAAIAVILVTQGELANNRPLP